MKHELCEWDLLTVVGVAKHFAVHLTSPEKSMLIAFYKPVGYVCSKSDPHNKTIYELLPQQFQHYHYIGRLDKDSTGLVLLTNTQALVHERSHPSHNIEKHYDVVLNKAFDPYDIDVCLQWVVDEWEVLRVKSLQCYNKKIHIVLNEGKNRHIRRMLSVLHYHVESLCRVAEWPVSLWDLQEWSRCDVSSVLDTSYASKES